MNILGLSAFYHDSSCCLLQNGELIAAVSEERFSRIKHDARLPAQAFRYCLAQANLTPSDLDCIAYYENPVNKVARQLSSQRPFSPSDDRTWIDPNIPLRLIRENLGFDGEIICFDHHASHAASAYFYSGFQESAIFTVDGVGEWTTTAYGYGAADHLSIFETVDFPHSLGLLYATITAFLGFQVNNGEYKVMGLASYGEPIFLDQLWQLIELKKKGQFRLDMDYFSFVSGNQMYAPQLASLFKIDPRLPGAEIKAEHINLAKSLQVLTEEILLNKLAYLHKTTGANNLSMAGGVALNAVANGRIRRESPFKNIFVQPAAGDAGSCLGAAALAHLKLTGQRHTQHRLPDVYLGPQFSNRKIAALLSSTGVVADDFTDREDQLIQAVVERLLANKIVGWFHGRMEFGPRSLGARSILANPLAPDIKDRINQAVKKRETFRPFAPSVLHNHLAQHFDIAHQTPFMIETCQVTSALELPAITHVDGSARPQTLTGDENPRFAKLLTAFYEKTNCPILVNTSFNQSKQPIICTPTDALLCIGTSSIDVLVIEDFIVDKDQLPGNWEEILIAWNMEQQQIDQQTNNLIHNNLYTFI